jgi:hypothetical protein
MISRMVLLTTLVAVVATLMPLADAFAPQPALTARAASLTQVSVFGGGKKKKQDLSDIESRDMTRGEMEDLNKQNTEIMNMELQMMTVFSLVISLPILYLCWVAFYSD